MEVIKVANSKGSKSKSKTKEVKEYPTYVELLGSAVEVDGTEGTIAELGEHDSHGVPHSAVFCVRNSAERKVINPKDATLTSSAGYGSGL